MNYSKILVIGASGLLGKALYNEFVKDYKVRGTYLKRKKSGFVKLDIRNKKEVQKLFAEIKPDIVFQPAAEPHVDLCEKEKVLTYATNVAGTKNVVESCLAANAKLVYFSSDYVFDGKSGPYKETDKPNPVSEYGRQKAECESIVKEKLKDYIIVRMTAVFGYDADSSNFVMQMIKTLNDKETRKVPVDQYSNPTYVRDIAIACRALIEGNKRGVYNLAGDENINRCEFAAMIADVFGFDKSLIIPVKTSGLGQIAKRPLNCGLYNGKIKKDIKIKFHTIMGALHEIKNEAIKQIRSYKP